MGFMEDVARRAREELEGLRRTLAEAGLPFGASASPGAADGESGGLAGAQSPGSVTVVEATARRSDSWPKEVREAYAALELPLGSGRAEVAAAHARLVERFSADRFDDLSDGAARCSSVRARLDGAEQRLVGWLDGASEGRA
jgi:hypothetical protein